MLNVNNNEQNLTEPTVFYGYANRFYGWEVLNGSDPELLARRL